MKYGQELQKKIIVAWEHSYIPYDTFKNKLKTQQNAREWDEQHEKEFIRMLDEELSKVSEFINTRKADIDVRIIYCKDTIQGLQANPVMMPHYEMMKDALNEILTELSNLSEFVRANYASVQKILKKHDKQTGIALQPIFLKKLKEVPLDRQVLDPKINYASALLNICMDRYKRESHEATLKECHHIAKKAITKYWVHPDNVEEVIATIIPQLSMVNSNLKKTKKCNIHNASSVYFDTANFDLYVSRLQKDKEYESIKLKSRESLYENDVYMEHKKICIENLDSSPIKKGFVLAKDQVNEFLNGETAAGVIVDSFNNSSEDNDIDDSICDTVDNIKKKISKKKLALVLKAFYDRKIFQLSKDEQYKVSLDCNLVLTREAVPCCKSVHLGSDMGHSSLDNTETLHFPYAILKTQLPVYSKQQPEWIMSLIERHLIYEVPSFSKYLHGISYFYPEKLALYPWWLSELGVDICKERTNMDNRLRSLSFKPLVDVKYSQSTNEEKNFQITKPESERSNIKQPDSTYSGSTVTHINTPSPIMSYNCVKTKHNSMEINVLDEKVKEKALQKILKKKKKQQDIEAGIKKPKVKVRVEPKVFFANERTFISWLQFCALLLTVALNLMNFGDTVSRIVGGIFIGLAGGIAIYALYRFEKRAWMINHRIDGRYDDIWGPVILCVLLVTALIVNFYLRFK